MKVSNKIFPRLLLTIIAISIIPLVAVSIFVLTTGVSSLRDETLNHLNAIASIQEARVSDIIQTYRGDIALVTSRTRLRAVIKEFVETDNTDLLPEITQILHDASDSLNDIKDVHIYNMDGYIIASTNVEYLGLYLPHVECFEQGEINNDIRGLLLDEDGKVYAHLSGPLIIDDEVIAVIMLDINITSIQAIVTNYSGLQNTGETLFAMKNSSGESVFIHALRFDPDAALAKIAAPENPDLPILQALDGKELLIDNAIDYRGEPVLAVTRYIDKSGWGMVVKIDKAEAFAPVARLRNMLVAINAILLIIIFVTALYWARRITHPITSLTRTALEFGDGISSARAEINSSDEIGALASTFNLMADNISQHQNLLEESVKNRTARLREEIEERKQIETALRQSEENYRQSIDNNPLPIHITGQQGEIIYGNKALLELYGYKSITDFRTISPQDRYTPESLEIVTGIIKKFSQTGRPTDSFEIDLIRNNGELRHVTVINKSILWFGKPQVQSIYMDFTETIKMQEAVMAKDRLASIGQLVSGVAHELNNPLTGIIGFTDLILLRDDIPADLKSDLETIKNEAHRTADIVKNLLTFSRNQPGAKQTLNINDVIKTVLNLRKLEMKRQNIEIKTELDESLPTVNGNASQLHQVFYNIIINAEYFMKQAHGKGILTITTSLENNLVKISISDNGPGIESTILSRLFTPFFTTKEVGKGTGLGLSISYGIITEHNGTINVQSQEGNGTTFIIELPASVTKPEDDTDEDK